jgi:hypothetical protein
MRKDREGDLSSSTRDDSLECNKRVEDGDGLG